MWHEIAYGMNTVNRSYRLCILLCKIKKNMIFLSGTGYDIQPMTPWFQLIHSNVTQIFVNKIYTAAFQIFSR